MRVKVENYLIRFVCGRTGHDIVHIADVTVVGSEERVEEDVRKDLHDALDHFIDCVNEKWDDLMVDQQKQEEKTVLTNRPLPKS